MSISEVSARAVCVPVRTRTRMSTRELAQRDYLLVQVRTDDSHLVGLGYAYVGTSGGLLSADAVTDLMAPLLVGADPGNIVGHWERVYQELLLVGRRGILLRALSAVDIALWDLAAKRADVPLAVLLGGHRDRVPAYASGGYYRPDDGPWDKAVGAEIAANREHGFVDHKIKVGGLSIAEDAERVAAGVAALGERGRLAVDCNNAYPSAAEAIRAVRAFERAADNRGLWWVEEPLSPDDVAGHARLTATVDTPIATGEIHQTRWEFRDLISQEAADVLQPDAGVLGGVTEWMRVARAAEVFGIPVAPHWHANLHVQLAAATPGCIAIEHFTADKDIYNFERLLREDTRLQVEDGLALVPNAPGLGIELDEDAVNAFVVSR